MKSLYAVFAVSLLIASLFAPLHSQDSLKTSKGSPHLTGLHDFDFEVGEWHVHHRVSRTGGERWLEFEGTCRNRGLIDGFANVEEHAFNKPSGVTHGVALRAYDPKTTLWAIWWIDGRDPHASLDPPVKGHFENGVGTFYSDRTVDGKTIRTRFVWSLDEQVSRLVLCRYR